MAAMRNSIALVIMLAALAFLQYHLWFESGGIGDLMRLKKTLAEQLKQNEVLKKENDELAAQIQRIQKNEDAAEARARSELGMVKKGETFYQVVK
jgi:cell division protein FtsB